MSGYPMDPLLLQHLDFGGLVHKDASGALFTTVNMPPIQDSQYQACYHKAAPGGGARRKLGLVYGEWAPVEAYLRVDFAEQESPEFTPLSYWVHDGADSRGATLAPGVCKLATDTMATQAEVTEADAGRGIDAWAGRYQIMTKCCSLSGADCWARAGNSGNDADCYSGKSVNQADPPQGHTHAQAKAACENDGRRLCTE